MTTKKNSKRKFKSEMFNSLSGIARGWDRWGKINAARKAAKRGLSRGH